MLRLFEIKATKSNSRDAGEIFAFSELRRMIQCSLRNKLNVHITANVINYWIFMKLTGEFIKFPTRNVINR